MDIQTGDGIRFERAVRTRKQMQSVLMAPEAILDATELYFNFVLANAGRYGDAFTRYNLTFALVLLPSLKIGLEYVKTHGHYHPNQPGSQIAYPEVYTHYYGDLYLLMQRRIDQRPDELEDCVLYKMQPGRSITIPPGYFHILINPSGQPALMAGLYCRDSFPQYEQIQEMAGAAYYLIEVNGQEKVVANPRYSRRPPLRLLADLQRTPFAPPHEHLPLWSAFVREPQAYAMLSDPFLTKDYFNSERANGTG
jgi:glucose-6-phosphate isomerase